MIQITEGHSYWRCDVCHRVLGEIRDNRLEIYHGSAARQLRQPIDHVPGSRPVPPRSIEANTVAIRIPLPRFGEIARRCHKKSCQAGSDGGWNTLTVEMLRGMAAYLPVAISLT